MSSIFRPLESDAPIRKSRRDLPHWKQEGASYFLTFRTADSIPQSKLRLWTRERALWLAEHPKPWSQGEQKQHKRQFEDRIECWLDEGYGACVLRRPEIASIVAGSMRFFDTLRYALDEFVVMPNHVHAVIQPWGGHQLETILHSWKSFTATAINRRLERKQPFWQSESFDHIIRHIDDLARFRAYIRENPKKARLKPGEYILGCGSGLLVES